MQDDKESPNNMTRKQWKLKTFSDDDVILWNIDLHFTGSININYHDGEKDLIIRNVVGEIFSFIISHYVL